MPTKAGMPTKRERRFKRKEKARKARRGEAAKNRKRLPWWRRFLMRLRGQDHHYDPRHGTFGKDGYLR